MAILSEDESPEVLERSDWQQSQQTFSSERERERRVRRIFRRIIIDECPANCLSLKRPAAAFRWWRSCKVSIRCAKWLLNFQTFEFRTSKLPLLKKLSKNWKLKNYAELLIVIFRSQRIASRSLSDRRLDKKTLEYQQIPFDTLSFKSDDRVRHMSLLCVSPPKQSDG